MPGNLDLLKKQQEEISRQVILTNQLPQTIHSIAAADISCSRFSQTGYAAVVVCSYPGLQVVDTAGVIAELQIPYIPGFLGFREWPLIRSCLEKLNITPDVLICDGQGLAHPRRAGLACHAGVKSGLITIGCAKSHLIGIYHEPGPNKGDKSDLTDRGDKIGEVVRTRDGVKPLFISPGHRIDFAHATEVIMALCPKYRQPIPIQLAHRAVNAMRVKSNIP